MWRAMAPLRRDGGSRFSQSAAPSEKIFQNPWRDWAAENALDQ
jgi:hypothetical protein